MFLGPLFLLLVFGSGASYLAEGTVPGDTLYPVKVEMNEPVSRIFMTPFSLETQGYTELILAERRIAEAKELSGKASLDSKTAQALSHEFTVHAKRALGIARQLSESGKEEDATALTTAIEMALTAGMEPLAIAQYEDVMEAQAELSDWSSVRATMINMFLETSEVSRDVGNGAAE